MIRNLLLAAWFAPVLIECIIPSNEWSLEQSLLFACDQGDEPEVDFLLSEDGGADVTATNHHGNTCLSLARLGKRTLIEKYATAALRRRKDQWRKQMDVDAMRTWLRQHDGVLDYYVVSGRADETTAQVV